MWPLPSRKLEGKGSGGTSRFREVPSRGWAAAMIVVVATLSSPVTYGVEPRASAYGHMGFRGARSRTIGGKLLISL